MKHLIETAKNCALYVRFENDLRTWIMISKKTGTHTIIDKNDFCNPLRPSLRVRAHWNGFLRNQSKP
jgi:hypothetical protein